MTQSNLIRMNNVALHGIDFALKGDMFCIATKAKSQFMSLFRKFFVIFTSCFTVFPYGAQAELQLETWKTYGLMAEQSAICASFSKLMEAQSILNLDLGDLWKERRKFAGAVIRKAVSMELNRDSSETEIDNLISSYSDWVLSSLMINHDQESKKSKVVPEKTETEGHKIKTLINSHCKSLFQQGDNMIRKQRPDLAYLLQNTPEFQFKPQISPPEIDSSPKAKQNDSPSVYTPALKAAQNINQKPQSAGKAIELSMGGGDSLKLNLPLQKPILGDRQPNPAVPELVGKETTYKDRPLPSKLVQISGPAPRPNTIHLIKLDQPHRDKSSISASKTNSAALSGLIPLTIEHQAQQDSQNAKPASVSHVNAQTMKVKLSDESLFELLERQAAGTVNLIVPRQSVDKQKKQKAGNYFAQLGAFARLENAKREKQHLETKFATLFTKLPLYITEINGSGQQFYRIQTSGLSQKHITTLCDMMWPHKIPCLSKYQNAK